MTQWTSGWYYEKRTYVPVTARDEWRQAQCSGCKTLSAPRPVGETPENWERDVEGQGRYWCPECALAGRS